MIIHAPISVGELVDKITILELKITHATDPRALEHVQHELDQLLKLLEQHQLVDTVAELRAQLKGINAELWDTESFKRRCVREQTFLDGFVVAARNVYIKNDVRARIKRQINDLCNSNIVEEKIY